MNETNAAGHDKAAAIGIDGEIQLTAELIFYILHHEGEMKLEQLKEKVNQRMPFFDWGIGWLVGKGDIEIIAHEDGFHVRRKGPTPVVIPLRGV